MQARSGAGSAPTPTARSWFSAPAESGAMEGKAARAGVSYDARGLGIFTDTANRHVLSRHGCRRCSQVEGSLSTGTADGRQDATGCLLDDSALRGCDESRGTRLGERHSAHLRIHLDAIPFN